MVQHLPPNLITKVVSAEPKLGKREPNFYKLFFDLHICIVAFALTYPCTSTHMHMWEYTHTQM